jgi:hypothetical protein
VDIIQIINAVAFVAFIALTALAVVRMALRLILYWAQDNSPSVILRRDIALLGALLFTFGAPTIIQFFGWGDLFFEGGTLRLPYTIVRDVIGVGGLAYWVWVEYFVIGVEGKEAD